MKILKSHAYRKIILVICFIFFGLVLGFLSAWFHRRYDQWFPLNVPGDFLYSFLSNYLLASVLAWVVIGTLITFIFRPKIVAWIMGVYLVVFGGLWIWWESLHW
jgi:hypothetical protein